MPYLVQSVSRSIHDLKHVASNSPLHANKLQVAAKVPRIQTRDGQAISKASHRRLEIALIEVRVQVRCPVHGGVHVGPDQGNGASGDAAALVRDLDGDVLFSFRDNDLRHRELLLVLTVRLDDGAERVLQGLEKHMRQVSWHIHEVNVRVAHKLDLGGLEEPVVILANEARVFDGFLSQVLDIRLCADDTDVSGVAVVALVSQGDVLTDEHTDAYARHVEAIEERLNVVVNLHALSLALILQNTLRHGRHNAIVSPLDAVEGFCKSFVVQPKLGGPVSGVVHHGEVSPCGDGLLLVEAIAVVGLRQRCVLPLFDTRISCRLRE